MQYLMTATVRSGSTPSVHCCPPLFKYSLKILQQYLLQLAFCGIKMPVMTFKNSEKFRARPLNLSDAKDEKRSKRTAGNDGC